MFVIGCSTCRHGGENWPAPNPPVTKSVSVMPDVDGERFYLEGEDARNLADNVCELKAYIKKLEVLIETMKNYYGAE